MWKNKKDTGQGKISGVAPQILFPSSFRQSLTTLKLAMWARSLGIQMSPLPCLENYKYYTETLKKTYIYLCVYKHECMYVEL